MCPDSSKHHQTESSVIAVNSLPAFLHSRLQLGCLQDGSTSQLTARMGNTSEEQFGSLVLLANHKNICYTGHYQEVFHLTEAVSLHICVCQICVDIRLV